MPYICLPHAQGKPMPSRIWNKIAPQSIDKSGDRFM
jgi:hypothetical protein